MHKMQESAGYPCESTKLSQVTKDSLFDLPDEGQTMNVAWFQQNVWPEAQSFEAPDSDVICGMQANIFKIHLRNAHGDTVKLVAKRVKPKELPDKANQQVWRDFLASVQTEVDFYNGKAQMVPELFPKVYYSGGYSQPQDYMSSFHLIVMEDVSDKFYQKTSMDRVQAETLMKALAQFHATFWSKAAPGERRGSFWVLSRRKHLGEIEAADQTWKSMLGRFPKAAWEGLNIPNLEGLGAALASKAQILDDFIAANLKTQIHGDCKGWNLFFGNDKALFIDLQWTGLGHPLQDVAYSLTTSLDPDLLSDMDSFVDCYLEALKALNLPSVDMSSLKSQFDLVWLDYARVIFTGLWKRFSPEQIAQYEKTIGPSMIGRSFPHALFIIKKVHDLLMVKRVV